MTIIPAQILFTKSFQLRNSLVCDYVYVSNDAIPNDDIKNKYHYLRIRNIEVEFMLAKLPFMEEIDFKNKVKNIAGDSSCQVKFTKMKDCCLFSFNYLYTYPFTHAN